MCNDNMYSQTGCILMCNDNMYSQTGCILMCNDNMYNNRRYYLTGRSSQ